MFSNCVAFQLTQKPSIHNNYAIGIHQPLYNRKINAIFPFCANSFLFSLSNRWTRCNPKENFHKMGQQTFEKGNSRFCFSLQLQLLSVVLSNVVYVFGVPLPFSWMSFAINRQFLQRVSTSRVKIREKDYVAESAQRAMIIYGCEWPRPTSWGIAHSTQRRHFNSWKPKCKKHSNRIMGFAVFSDVDLSSSSNMNIFSLSLHSKAGDALKTFFVYRGEGEHVLCHLRWKGDD